MYHYYYCDIISSRGRDPTDDDGGEKEGKKNGLYENWDNNGKLNKKENYKGGKLNGSSEIYFGNGQLNLKGNFGAINLQI